MDELRRAARALTLDPPVEPPPIEELARRNAHRRNRRRAIVGAVLVALVAAGSLVAITRRSTPPRPVVTTPEVSSGVLAVATAHGVTLVDEHKGVVAEVDLGFAPFALEWSPNGRWVLATAEQGRAVLVGRDGNARRQVSTLPVAAAHWIGDETLLISVPTGTYEVSPAGVPHEVGGTAGLRSPDGRRMAWTDDTTGDLVVGNADGSGGRSFGHLPESDAGVLLHSWSPDGRWIIYSAYQVQSASLAEDGVPLYAIRATDGFAFRIGVMLPREDWARWSPNGRTLVVVEGGGRMLTERKVLRACDLGVPTCVELPGPPEASAFDPAWSPTGARLAFVWVGAGGVRGAEGELLVSNADGGNSHRVAGVAPGVLHPMWVADGSAIVVLRSLGSAVGVERVLAGGGTPTPVATVDVPASLFRGQPGHALPPVAWSASSR